MAQPSFEKDLEKLESVVAALEEGGLSLDESLKRFEEGVKLSRRCEKALHEAEKKIEVLMRTADGELETAPFDEASAEEAPAEDPGQSKGKPAAKAKASAAHEAGAAAEPDEAAGGDSEDDGELLF